MTPPPRPVPPTPARDNRHLRATIADCRAACAAALAQSAAHESPRTRLRADQVADGALDAAARVRQYARSCDAAAAALAFLPPAGPARAAAVRRDLLRAALGSLAYLPGQPLAPAVIRRLCEVFHDFCDPPRGDTDCRYRPDLDFHGCALAGCAALTRFPAGQLDWERSGLPRSYLLRMPFRDLPRVCRTIVRDLGGLRPCFTAHMGVKRYPLLFVEVESHRSYHRMAQSMAMQPDVKGLLMEAWFHSPETIRISSHLAWTNRTPLAHGATLTDLGPATPADGFLTGSVERRRLFDAGLYRPTIGLIIWPRRALLAWAAGHPEFGVEADTG